MPGHFTAEVQTFQSLKPVCRWKAGVPITATMMYPSLISALLLLPTNIMARTLFVGSYGGEILTVQLDQQTGAVHNTSNTTQSAPSPSWQEIAQNGTVLYTVEENTAEDASVGAITSYKIGPNGVLTKITSAKALASVVNLAVSPDQKTLFAASYSDSGVCAYSTDETGALTHLQDWTFTLDAPGTIPDRQDAPHPHQALFDPTGKFVLVPDLGADLIRIFSIDSPTEFSLKTPIPTTPGRGPRHAMFYPSTGIPKFYFLIAELASTVTVYSVSYNATDIILSEVQTVSTLPANATTTTTTSTATASPLSTPSAAEIALSPGAKQLYAANRNDKTFPDSHSISTFSVDSETGKLTMIENFPSGVETPRHISLDNTGTWFIAEGQDSDDIKVFRRNNVTGLIEPGAVSTLSVPGGAVCAQWLD